MCFLLQTLGQWIFSQWAIKELLIDENDSVHFHFFATKPRSTASLLKLPATQAVRKPPMKTRVLVNNLYAFFFRRWVNGYFLSGQLKNYLLMKMTVFVNGGSGRGWTDM